MHLPDPDEFSAEDRASWWWNRTAAQPELPRDADALWQRMQAQIHTEAAVSRAPSPPLRAAKTPVAGVQRRGWVVGVATAAVLVAAAAVVRYAGADKVDDAAIVYRTLASERATVTLADSTQVTIAPATTLTVARREITLDGQALFLVRSHQRDPFTVLAQGITTRVLGTEFSVQAYDSLVTVAVRSGRVAAAGVVLGANDVVRAVKQTNGTEVQVLHQQDLEPHFAFANGKLALSRIRLRDAIPALNRWYDADVQLANPALGDKVLDATFRAGSRADLAELLELLFDGRVARAGRTVTLYAK